ncbi:MAG: cytochrome c peroxidase [Chloroherpetonaceae bacterium]
MTQYSFGLILIFTTLCNFFFLGCSGKIDTKTPEQSVQELLLTRLEKLDTLLTQLHRDLQSGRLVQSPNEIRERFLECRDVFKRTEFLTEYYFPSKEINGAALERIEDNDPNQFRIAPQGFQAIESHLFPEVDTAATRDLITETRELRNNLRHVHTLFSTRPLQPTQIHDAIKLQLVRIITLGISGYDSPVAYNSVNEAIASMQSLQEAFSYYKTALEQKEQSLYGDIHRKFEEAITYLSKNNTDFNTFNRAEFIVDYVNPLAVSLNLAREKMSIEPAKHVRLFNPTAATLFEVGAFNPLVYAPHYAKDMRTEQIELGRLLFYDPILSKNGKRACASCHQPEKAFVDNLPRALTMQKQKDKLRNTPTLLYAAYQESSSYDQRTQKLEDRVALVVHSAEEMNSSLEEVASKLKRSQGYLELFQKAFGGEAQNAINEENVKMALGMYMRSIGSFNSRFDQYMRGDKSKMTPQEVHGFNLFMGKAKCGTCHFMPLFNGTVPPMFLETEAEVIGVPKEAKWKNATIDPDIGKMAINGIELNKYMFKTPTVRNVELTAPYMHNGVYNTLEEVMQFYNMGGGAGIGIDLPNQTLPSDTLGLSKQEIQDLIAFLKTLTDTTGTTDKPAMLPSFSDVRLNRRKVGGAY